MIKPKLWKGNDLEGEWQVTLKVDGVRALFTPFSGYHSRAGKELHNIPFCGLDDFEVFMGDWESTITAVRTKDSQEIPKNCLYSLDPIDKRLVLRWEWSPTAEKIRELLIWAIRNGYEGLVLRQGDKWLKVKPTETYDVEITGVQPGKGRNEGRVGALITPMGKVGTGFTDALREQLVDVELGTIIEVECMSLTKGGKFRHPRLKRIRWDKNEVSI